MNGPRIRLIQSTLGDGDVAANLNQALALIAQCAGQVDLVVFSETYIPGFPRRRTWPGWRSRWMGHPFPRCGTPPGRPASAWRSGWPNATASVSTIPPC